MAETLPVNLDRPSDIGTTASVPAQFEAPETNQNVGQLGTPTPVRKHIHEKQILQISNPLHHPRLEIRPIINREIVTELHRPVLLKSTIDVWDAETETIDEGEERRDAVTGSEPVGAENEVMKALNDAVGNLSIPALPEPMTEVYELQPDVNERRMIRIVEHIQPVEIVRRHRKVLRLKKIVTDEQVWKGPFLQNVLILEEVGGGGEKYRKSEVGGGGGGRKLILQEDRGDVKVSGPGGGGHPRRILIEEPTERTQGGRGGATEAGEQKTTTYRMTQPKHRNVSWKELAEQGESEKPLKYFEESSEQSLSGGGQDASSIANENVMQYPSAESGIV